MALRLIRPGPMGPKKAKGQGGAGAQELCPARVCRRRERRAGFAVANTEAAAAAKKKSEKTAFNAIPAFLEA